MGCPKSYGTDFIDWGTLSGSITGLSGLECWTCHGLGGAPSAVQYRRVEQRIDVKRLVDYALGEGMAEEAFQVGAIGGHA